MEDAGPMVSKSKVDTTRMAACRGTLGIRRFALHRGFGRIAGHVTGHGLA